MSADVGGVAASAGGAGEDQLTHEEAGSDENNAVLSAEISEAEENLHRSVVFHGPSSHDTRVIATDLVLAYNHLGVRLLSQNDIKGSLLLLQKAKLLTSRERPYLGDARLQLRAVTLNNLGCLMKKWGKPRVGISYLARALKIEAKAPGIVDNPAGTHVNMSAALSTLGMHRAAAIYAVQAVGLASRAVEQAGVVKADVPADGGGEGADHKASGGDGGSGSGNGGGGGGGGGGSSGSGVPNDGRVDSTAEEHDGKSPEEVTPLASKNADPGVTTTAQPEHKEALSLEANGGAGRGNSRGSRLEIVEGTAASHEKEATAGGLLAIAYFNLAVEREHLGQPDAALEAYEKARATSNLHLDPESPVAKGIELALETASTTIALSPRCARPAAVQSSCLSFPSIGKLYFGPQPRGAILSGSGLSPRRVSPRRVLDQDDREEDGCGGGSPIQSPRKGARQGAKQDASGQSPLERAYTSQQPSPPSRRKRQAHFARLSGKSPPPSTGPGPQRAGKWARDAHRPIPENMAQTLTSTGGGGGGGTQPGDKRRAKQDDMMWRARACAELGCSPKDARRAQLSGRGVSVDEDRRKASGGSPAVFELGGVRVL